MGTTCAEYKLLWAGSALELSKVVTQHLAEGWSLYEGPAMVQSQTFNFAYAQAVIR
jgi:hypothetical protein